MNALLELLAVGLLAGFVWFLWPPLVLLVGSVALWALAIDRERKARRLQ